MKVKITKVTKDIYWYKEDIGNIFEVDDSDKFDEYYRILNTGHYIAKTDCEIVKDISTYKIKIISCHVPRYWYSHCVGFTYDVENFICADGDDSHYRLIDKPSYIILKSDCKIINEIQSEDFTTKKTKEISSFAFHRPLVHENLKTWSSCISVKIGEYEISLQGDDGNRQKNGDISVRHSLLISKNDKEITEELGFVCYGNTFQDFLDAIEMIKHL